MENPALSHEDDSEDADPYEIINISVREFFLIQTLVFKTLDLGWQ